MSEPDWKADGRTLRWSNSVEVLTDGTVIVNGETHAPDSEIAKQYRAVFGPVAAPAKTGEHDPTCCEGCADDDNFENGYDPTKPLG